VLRFPADVVDWTNFCFPSDVSSRLVVGLSQVAFRTTSPELARTSFPSSLDADTKPDPAVPAALDLEETVVVVALAAVERSAEVVWIDARPYVTDLSFLPADVVDRAWLPSGFNRPEPVPAVPFVFSTDLLSDVDATERGRLAAESLERLTVGIGSAGSPVCKRM